MADAGKRVIVTGLDTDYLGRPFEPMPRLLAVAEEIIKLLAICVQLRQSRRAHAAPRRLGGTDRRGRRRHVRTALPALLRAESCA